MNCIPRPSDIIPHWLRMNLYIDCVVYWSCTVYSASVKLSCTVDGDMTCSEMHIGMVEMRGCCGEREREFRDFRSTRMDDGFVRCITCLILWQLMCLLLSRKNFSLYMGFDSMEEVYFGYSPGQGRRLSFEGIVV